MSEPRAPLGRREQIAFAALLGLSALLLVLGWKRFEFLTDDAFIAFRYISNRHAGHGYVWNAPPFLPVEGYTSFLWLLILDLVWSVSGMEPPRSANLLALLFAALNLLGVALILLRRPMDAGRRSWRVPMVAVALLFLLSNTTFLAWTSSGLETALFCALISWWGFACLRVEDPGRGLLAASSLAAAIALCRPDGLLFCAATLALAFARWRKRGGGLTPGRVACSLAPLCVVPLHLSWRFSTYGAWLPNTYYAKVGSARPLSGLIYAASFVLEYGLWFVLILWLLALWTAARAGRRPWAEPGPVVVGTALLAHVAYYTLKVGGDHFEYRVYNQLLPFVVVGLIWALEQLRLRAGVTIGLIFAFFLVSLPVGWTHWALTHELNTREQTYRMQVDIAPSWPVPVRWYAELFDRSQGWLIPRLVGVRRQTHAVFVLDRMAAYPAREQGALISPEGRPVLARGSVGVVGWMLPNVYILDKFGLNDYVIARGPVRGGKTALMAHEHRAPKGYLESFRPNVVIKNGAAVVRRRERPLSDEQIRVAERRWRAIVDGR